MEVLEITLEEYGNITDNRTNVFCQSNFLRHNLHKTGTVRCFLGHDKKNRLALAVGESEWEWNAPFSAPFSTIAELQTYIKIDYYYEFIKKINEIAKANAIQRISVMLPPDIYGMAQNAKTENALLGNGYQLEYQELNYSFNLHEVEPNNYEKMIHRNARKNLNIAIKKGLSLKKCTSEDDKRLAYQVIKANRSNKGYYLAMSEEEVLSTSHIVKNDFFLVELNGNAIASAVVFHVANNIVQVIYWGDLPSVGEFKPINFLAFELIKYYKAKGISHIDIGPSSLKGEPNMGLCDFKESIGCEVTSKHRFKIELKK